MFKKIVASLLLVAALGMAAFPVPGLSKGDDLAWGGRLPDLIIKSVPSDRDIAWGGRLPDLIIRSAPDRSQLASAESATVSDDAIVGEQVAWGGRLPDLIIRSTPDRNQLS